MGYILNELANLPVDDKVHFYVFVINGEFRDPLYEVVESNFKEIAASIGGNAVIAMGTHPKQFTTSIARQYLGRDKSDPSFVALLPALLITDSHPEQLSEGSMRLVVPLRNAEPKFGTWHQFFASLGAFVRGENDGRVFPFGPWELDQIERANLIGSSGSITAVAVRSVATLQSLASVILFFLTALAIRRRFQIG